MTIAVLRFGMTVAALQYGMTMAALQYGMTMAALQLGVTKGDGCERRAVGRVARFVMLDKGDES
jgi:hypothetical protein